MSPRDSSAAMSAAKRFFDLKYRLRNLAEGMSKYRFVRAIQYGADCPSTGRSCVTTGDCICLRVADDLLPVVRLTKAKREKIRKRVDAQYAAEQHPNGETPCPQQGGNQ